VSDSARRLLPASERRGRTRPALDIVCIKAGDEHDILEVYGDDPFELFWVYEPGPEGGRLGHLHRRTGEATSGLGKADPA
jgi:hypothetical protein